MEIHQMISMSNSQKLKTMEKKRKDQQRRVRNFDVRRTETGAVIQNRKETSGVEGGKEYLLPMDRKGQCSKEDQCNFQYESNDRAQNQNTLPPRLPSHPSHEVEVFRRKEVSNAESNHGAILRQPCRYCLKDTCTRTSCGYWHPPECQFHKTETGCKARDNCLFPHNEVEKPKKGYNHPKRRESDDKDAVAAVKNVPQLGCVSQVVTRLGEI